MSARYSTLAMKCYLPKNHEQWNASAERIIYTDHYDNLKSAIEEIDDNPELKLELIQFLDVEDLKVKILRKDLLLELENAKQAARIGATRESIETLCDVVRNLLERE